MNELGAKERYQQLCERLLPWEEVPVLVEPRLGASRQKSRAGCCLTHHPTHHCDNGGS